MNDRDAFLPPLKSRSNFKAGSYLDDDSLEVVHKVSKAPNQFQNVERKLHSPRGTKKNVKLNPKESKIKTKNPSAIEKMYHSLKTAGQGMREQADAFQFDGPQVSINVGSRFGAPESLDYSDIDQQQQQAMNTFEIATGSINHGNRSINYTVQEILETCFAINLVVPATEQSWMVFVPSSETVLELLRIWKQKNNPDNMNKLCTWLLSCITLEFDEMMIVAAHFNHSLFQKCYTQEIIESVQAATIKIQSHMRRFLSNKALRVRLLKAKQIQESRLLASMRVRAVQRNREKNNDSLQYDEAANIRGFDPRNPSAPVKDANQLNTAELLVSIKQIISDSNQEARNARKKKRKGSPKRGRRAVETLNSTVPVDITTTTTAGTVVVPPPPIMSSSAKVAQAPKSPGRSGSRKGGRGKKIQFKRSKTGAEGAGDSSTEENRNKHIEREVHTLKSDFDCALTNFQSELDNLRTELTSQQSNAATFGRPLSPGAPLFRSPINSRSGSRNGARINPTNDKIVMNFGESYVSNSTDPDSMRQEISSLLLKISSLEEHLNAQKIANERAQEIAKLEIMSAKLEAESAVERAAARVRNETIQEIASQMKEIERERARQEEEKMQRDLIREESMRREIEKKQSHMSEKLKKELFKQQLLQQQEQAALIQKQQEMQDKLNQAHFSQNHSNLTSRGTSSSPSKQAGLGGGNDHVPLISPGQKASSVQVNGAVYKGLKEASVSSAETPVSTASAAPKKKNSWNWLMFGGTGSGKQSASQTQQTVPPTQPKQQQAPQLPAAQSQLYMAPPVIPKPEVVVERVFVEEAPVEPVVDTAAIDAEKRRIKAEEKAAAKAKAAVERDASNAQRAKHIQEQQLIHKSATSIQKAALRFISWRRFCKTRSFTVLRANTLLKLVDNTKDENVINTSMSTAMELDNEDLATRSISRLNNLVAKYEKSEVLFPADYEAVVAFTKHFVKDVSLVKKAFDILNVVLKLNSERFDARDTTLIELLMQTIETYMNDPLMCFKVTRCIYRMNEKSATSRAVFGSNIENLVSIRKLFELYLKNPSIIENVMKCIINLCIDSPANQDAFNAIAICDCVFFAFMEHLKVERLFYLICRAMVNLCANNHNGNQTQLAKGIYPNIFIKAVMLYKSNPRAIEQVITCVLSIVANHKVNKTKFQEAGLCEVLLDLVRISEAYPSILTNCFWALSNLTSATNPARKALHVKIMDTLKKYEDDETNPELARHAKIALHRIFRATASRAATPIASMRVVGSDNVNTIAAPPGSADGVNGMSSAPTPGVSRQNTRGARQQQNQQNQRLEGFTESVVSELST